MVKIGFTVVRVAAQTFYHATWLVLATVHGDDFMAAGETQSLDIFHEELEHMFVTKKMPRIGPLEVGGVVSLWRLTYFVLRVRFQGGLPFCL